MIRIIDSHNHLGGCRIFLGNFTEEALLDTMEKAGVYGAVLMPFPGAEDIPATHDRIAAMAKKYPGRFWGISSVNPHDATDGFEKESTRAVKELGFKALKLHTVGHAVNPTSPDAMRLFELARSLGVAVCAHTGTGIPFSLPALLLPAAKKFPDLPIVMAHAGATLLTQEAIITASQCDNIFLEMSWCPANMIQMAVNTIGSSRVMFGVDNLVNMKSELEKMTSLPINESQMEDILSKTACTVYGLDIS